MTEFETPTQLVNLQQKESIKLIKNTKGYNWELKIHIEGDEESIKRLEKLNQELEGRYGGQ